MSVPVPSASSSSQGSPGHRDDENPDTTALGLKQSHEQMLRKKLHRKFKNTVHMALFWICNRLNRCTAIMMGKVASPLLTAHSAQVKTFQSEDGVQAWHISAATGENKYLSEVLFCLSDDRPVSVLVCIPIYLPIYPSIYPSIYLSIELVIYLTNYLSIYLSIYTLPCTLLACLGYIKRNMLLHCRNSLSEDDSVRK